MDEELAAAAAALEADDAAAAAAVVVAAAVEEEEEKEEEGDRSVDHCGSDGEACGESGRGYTYVSRTIRLDNITSRRRYELLPGYPLAKVDLRTLPLLANVATVNRDACEKESFLGGHGICPYEFKRYRYIDAIDSFMLELYQDLLIEPSRRWKIHRSLIDYNLCRLRKCMNLYTEQTREPALSTLNELPCALEFYLQIDGKKFHGDFALSV